MKKENPYILPTLVTPKKYALELTPDLSSLLYDGKVTISLDVLEPTEKIVLNCKDVTITDAKLIQGATIESKEVTYDVETEMATIAFKKQLSKGKAELAMTFTGKMHDDMRSFYKSDYTDAQGVTRVMGTTQFEATDARKCFPCFDEPALKAVFGVTLVIPKELTAVSNMPIKVEKIQGNKKRVAFQDTPLMSSYLLAFVIGELDFIEGKTKQGTHVRVITTPGKKHQGDFALDVAIKTLEYYNDYFGVSYPLPKLDLIAVPDFEAGAMENWGLVTYRETALLIDPKSSSSAARQRVAIVVAHELAHMWFGNLVTMRWWNDLWLNEGFASWMEYRAVDHIFPAWDMWTQFYHDNVSLAMAADGLKSTHPIEINIVNPNEITEVFNAVVYNKGASIIRMLEQYIGEKTFQQGLQKYMTQFKYGNAVTNDLWSCLAEAAQKPVKEIMESWTKQPGYPVLTVEQKNNALTIKQERFFFTGQNQDPAQWYIPVAMSNSEATSYVELKEKEQQVKGSTETIINKSQVGFYLVKYTAEMLKRHEELIRKKHLSSLDRVGLSSNAHALARSNYIPATTFFSLVDAYQDEADYTVLSEIATNLTLIQNLFPNAPFSRAFNTFIRSIFQQTHNRLGWNERSQEEHTTKLLRATAISMLGFNEDPEVIQEAKKRFEQHRTKNNLNPNLRAVVYGLAAWSGDEETYEQLIALYREHDLQEEKVRLLRALALFKQKNLLERTLTFSLSKEVRSQDTLLCVAAVATNIYGKELAWQFFKDNWNEFYRRYGKEGHMMVYFVDYLASGFSTLEKKKEVQQFFTDHKAPTAKRAIEQALEEIQVNYNFVQNNEKEINAWLHARKL